MVISEKQIFELIAIAHAAINIAFSKGSQWNEWAKNVSQLLDKINSQQSQELKSIE